MNEEMLHLQHIMLYEFQKEIAVKKYSRCLLGLCMNN